MRKNRQGVHPSFELYTKLIQKIPSVDIPMGSTPGQFSMIFRNLDNEVGEIISSDKEWFRC